MSSHGLFVVGTGLRTGVHLTREARIQIEIADVVLYAVNDPLTEKMIHGLNGRARSLGVHYSSDRYRGHTYELMVEEIVREVSAGNQVCAVFYGHPGVGVDPGHKAIAEARRLGYRAEMFPAISSVDCMYADLNIDPTSGVAMYEASDYLIHHRKPDSTAGLVLWQAGAVAVSGPFSIVNDDGLELLRHRLMAEYGAAHPVIVYRAANVLGMAPSIDRLSISDLSSDFVRLTSTLYIPRKEEPQIDEEMRQAFREASLKDLTTQ